MKCSFPRLVVTSVFLFMIVRFPHHLQVIRVFPGSSAGKESACNMGDLSLIPGLGRFPWRRAWQPTAVFLPGESPWTEEPGGLQFMGSQSRTRLSN